MAWLDVQANGLLIAARVMGLLGGDRSGGTLLVPPSGAGSMGDEAMVAGLVARLNERGLGPVDVLSRGKTDAWPKIEGLGGFLEDSGGSPAARFFRILSRLRRYRRLMVVGADCIDGYYAARNSVQMLTIAEAGACMGLEAIIVGASFKENAAEPAKRALRRLSSRVALGARDPISKGRMDATGARPRLVADAAFMLDAGEVPEAGGTRAWLDGQDEAGRTVLGVNFNRQVLPKGSPRVSDLFDAFDRALSGLLSDRPDLSVLMIPHDYRGEVSDATQAADLASVLSQQHDGRAHMPTGRLTAPEAKALAKRCGAVLTGRMHLAIASLGAGTPVACVTYQGKFEGLFKHFSLEPLCLDPESAIEGAALRSMTEKLLDERDALRSAVADAWPHVRALSELNLEGPGAA
ncbi:MAG: polysaccharide pyruvyl transferase family protein [Planctomycetota bacterium]